MAKEYLSQKGIDFIAHDVSVDREKAREMVEKSGQMGVPVIIIGNDIIVGFNRSKLEQLLSQQ